ncbi:MAG: aminotransferase class I/II-fold pyridoxal phosphate-dependent enzyme [Dethiobacteria bacterium]|jgi:cystathionine beta-lyase family protein involved in aluminum resistance
MEWWQLAALHSNAAQIIAEAEKKVCKQHQKIAAVSLFNQAKVLTAFQTAKISEECFHTSAGYAYNDLGREKLEELFSRVFKGEDALVRPHFVSGTHTIYSCLRGLLRPGERLLSITGLPYDTLTRAIRGKKQQTNAAATRDSLQLRPDEGTLQDFGISFKSIALEDFRDPQNENVLRAALQKPTKVIFIQRSRGYDPLHPSLTVAEIGELITKVRFFNRDAIVLVDNCYGEFVEKKEPLEAGADLLAGSLIKNPGGGLAPTGGYVIGKKKYIEQIANTLSAPGLAKALGAFTQKRLYFQGFFMAPHTVAEALKGAVTTAAALETLGYRVEPRFDAPRGDLVQLIFLKSKEELERICRAVQGFSPVDSFFTPVEGNTPGYTVPIYMAAGTFVQGSTSEFSADAPLREPFTVYIQGGLTYQHILLGLAAILETCLAKKPD